MSSDVLTRVPKRADARVKYGAGEFQFGDLRVPVPGQGRLGQGRLGPGKLAPVVVFVHGGWWKAEYGLEYGGHLCEALRGDGVATWSLEYRRVGNAGGGWPGTFLDVAAGFDYLTTLGKSHPLDLGRVVAVGHSAGGHLAYWLAGREHVPAGSELHGSGSTLANTAPKLRGVIALAGAVDLRLVMDLAGYFTFAHDKAEVLKFMGALPKEAPERYRAGNPGELLPLNVPQWLLQGTEDDQIPPKLPGRWAERGRAMGEKVEVTMIKGADHEDVVDPESKAWATVRAAVLKALG